MKTKEARIFFICFFATSLIVFAMLLKLFWVPIGLAGVITLTCRPIYGWLLKKLKYRYFAALLATLFVFLTVLLPLGGMLTVGVTQVLKFSQNFAVQLQDGTVAKVLDDVSGQLTQLLNRVVDLDPNSFDLRGALLDGARSAAHVLYQYSPKVLGSTLHVLLDTALCLFFTFVFFADGGAFYRMIVGSLPIAIAHEEQIVNEVRQMVTATLLGMTANALVNGALLGLAYWVCGLPKPLLWGIVAVGFSFIPVIGAAIIWGGGAIVLVLHGQVNYAIGLVAYGLIIISQVDNVVKPLVMGNRVKIHPALLLIALLGGINLFGPSGLVFGPVLLALIVAAFRIYQEDFAPRRS